MRLSLAECKHIYERVFLTKLPGDLQYKIAAERAYEKVGPKVFSKILAEYRVEHPPEQYKPEPLIAERMKKHWKKAVKDKDYSHWSFSWMRDYAKKNEER